MAKLILIGGGTHLNSCLEIISENKSLKIIGILDKIKKDYFYNTKLKFIGKDKDILKFNFNHAFISIGLINNYKTRLKLIKFMNDKKIKFKSFIAKKSIISNNFIMGNGSIIMKQVVINRNVQIGDHTIINTGAIIEHDVKIGNNCHISTGAIINGGTIVEDNSFIGSGAIIANNRRITKNSFIKAGTVF
ncbi:acetyltransferase [Candidatus Pelagibacter sp. Uisw_099_02]|uniref:acetyltransferase n=1 Tax=Candidatus Pelagibacter sp. Uisw_099_02 TaxID=3230981 RepID=UPI0039EC1916|tara:strand:+ start:123 stop:692 length:570 start_codon:yes stop_codon:yes gene_type:complete